MRFHYVVHRALAPPRPGSVAQPVAPGVQCLRGARARQILALGRPLLPWRGVGFGPAQDCHANPPVAAVKTIATAFPSSEITMSAQARRTEPASLSHGMVL